MQKLFRTTFQGLYLEDEGPSPTFLRSNQTRATTSLTFKSEVSCALGCLTPKEDAGTDVFPKVFKTLISDLAPALARMFEIYHQTAQIPVYWRHAIVTPATKAAHATYLTPQSHVCCLQGL